MAFEFMFPDVGEGIHEGVLVNWLANEGEAVEKDQAIVEVETDKAVVEIPSPEKGVILKRYGEEGDVINVGDLLVVIGEPGESVSDKPVKAAKKRGEGVVGDLPDEQKGVEIPVVERGSQPARTNVMAAPAARKLAMEMNVDLSQVLGTGLGGMITEEDVRLAGGSKKKSAVLRKDPGSGSGTADTGEDYEKYGEVETVAYSGMRKSIGDHMEKAWKAPHVTQGEAFDMSKMYELRAGMKEEYKKEGVKLTYLAFIVQACVQALKKHPKLNASLDKADGQVVMKKYYNIGIAVDTGDGLVVPVLKNVEKMNLKGVANGIIDVATRGVDRKLDLEEMKGGSFTITNIGSIGGTLATPVINVPEVAILGVMKMEDRPVVRDGEIVVRKMMDFVLSYDHRVVDGAEAGRFLNTLKGLIEEPEGLVG